jgi:HSP20 family molecular chaperone IbpA
MSTDTRLAKTDAQPLARRDEQRTITPLCDVYESDSEVLVVADVPGATREDLQISFERGELSLTARRELPGQQGSIVRSEYRDAVFERRFAVPNGIDAAKISAELKDGVLRLRLPKSDAVKPRQIPVHAG